jgi:AcrR family transcriptional regulator
MRSGDARTQRSVDALRRALLTLVEVKSFEQISIKDLTEAAGLSYPTFFRRFASKEDLFRHVAADEIRQLLALGSQVGEPSSYEKAGSAMFDYVQQHRKLWTALLTGGAASVMRNEFMRVALEIAASRPRANPWLPLDLAVPFVASGTFEILGWWMKQPKDYPVSNVARLFDALISDTFSKSRDIELD